jgi:hypothetical protein
MQLHTLAVQIQSIIKRLSINVKSYPFLECYIIIVGEKLSFRALENGSLFLK